MDVENNSFIQTKPSVNERWGTAEPTLEMNSIFEIFWKALSAKQGSSIFYKIPGDRALVGIILWVIVGIYNIK
jgi:hypothetical protein